MLGKLCKHEIKATARYFLPLFLIALVLTPITRFTVSLGDFPGILKFIPVVIIFAYVASLIVVAAASVLLIVHRFYKSMVTEEGYLMHTLPVSSEMHIFAKLIISSLWMVASTLVIVLSLFLMFFTPDRFSHLLNEWHSLWNSIALYGSTAQITLTIIEIIICMLIGIFTSPLIFYASIALGQVISKNKVIGSVAGFFIIQIASQILGVIAMIPLGYTMDSIDTVSTQISVMTNLFLPFCIIIALVSSIILFLITDFIFKKKLNLE
ncbi:MAG: hypothetical protein ACERKN_16950 [Velocimicrobium sp.]